MGALRNPTAKEKRKIKSLRLAMGHRDKRPGLFAKELGISPVTMSKWRSLDIGGRYNERDQKVMAQLLGFTVEEFISLGE
ncbi:hypothetical protein N9917_04095 [Deltaproteobacteria bacterium]|nr:hypothetical protein [Deltaproteobacteria bacterium]